MKRIIAILTIMMSVIAANAQNEIDRMVNNFSIAGKCTFTSAVERNPVTHKIKKTVKILETENNQGPDFRTTFKKLAGTGNFKEKNEDGTQTMILTVNNKDRNRIYMLRTSEKYGKTKVTIIVKMKN